MPGRAARATTRSRKAKGREEEGHEKGGDALTAPVVVDRTGCRPCDQPHFFVADSPGTKRERALLVADYPIKTGHRRPQAADRQAGEQVVVTGTFSINSITGFAASNGSLSTRARGLQGKVLARATRSCPRAQTIQLEGRRPGGGLGGAPEGRTAQG